jgi:hypothetical protein
VLTQFDPDGMSRPLGDSQSDASTARVRTPPV